MAARTIRLGEATVVVNGTTVVSVDPDELAAARAALDEAEKLDRQARTLREMAQGLITLARSRGGV